MHLSNLHRLELTGLPCLLSVPVQQPDAGALLPVLCFLHGFAEAAPLPLEEAVLRHGPLHPGNPRTAVEHFIVVAPQLPAPGGDVWSRYAAAVLTIIEEVREDFPGDPDRTYLTGFSYGGNGVWDLALAQPGRWAALWPVDPTRVPPADPGLPVWLSAGEISRQRAQAFRQRLQLNEWPGETAGDRIYEDRGLDHVGTAACAYADPAVYAWLRARRRDNAPR
jgi:hypothetical protein